MNHTTLFREIFIIAWRLVNLDWWIGLVSVFIAFYYTPNFTLAQSSLDLVLLLE